MTPAPATTAPLMLDQCAAQLIAAATRMVEQHKVASDEQTILQICQEQLAKAWKRRDNKALPTGLHVSPSGRSFRSPSGRSTDLSTRQALRLILKGLADHREQAPGKALSLVDLQAIGWPGERVVSRAGANRVYTAIATLRRMGLKGVLLRRDDGYLLDPSIPIQR